MLPVPPGGGIPVATSSSAGLLSAAAIPFGIPVAPVGGYLGLAQFFASPVIDLTVIANTIVIPPTAARMMFITGILWEIKVVTACSVSPTFSIGSNSSSFNNVAASQTVAAFTTQVAETRASGTPVSPVSFVDLTASGLVVSVTTGATATALTARLFMSYGLAPV